MSNRRDDYKKTALTSGEAAEQRRQQVSAVSKQRRDALLRSKRVRREPQDAAGAAAQQPAAAAGDGPSLADAGAGVAEAVAALRAQAQVGTKRHLEALRHVRHLLSVGKEPPYEAAVGAGVVPLLVRALQPPNSVPEAGEAVLEAAWCLTNLAAGDHPAVAAALPAAPLLIAHLGGGYGTAVAEQSAWALGNMAGDSPEARSVLVANGAVRPLTGLVVAGVAALAGGDSLAPARTAAWALSNLLKGAGPEVNEVMAVAGLPGALPRLLAQFADTELAIEVAWLVAYLTAGPPAHLHSLLAAGVAPPLLQRMAAALAALQVGIQPDHARALLIPVLRSVGNLTAGAGSRDVLQLVTGESQGGNRSLLLGLQACLDSGHRGVQKEALWVLSSIAALPARQGVDVLLSVPGVVPQLTGLLSQAALDVRKEAGFVIANICAGGGGGTGDQELLTSLVGGNSQVLDAFLSFLRSPDPEAARLGLQFTEMVLRVLPAGAQAVEAADGIDALEQLQMRGPPELQAGAGQLVDKYFGDDYGLDE